jgi:hypothetical protein
MYRVSCIVGCEICSVQCAVCSEQFQDLRPCMPHKMHVGSGLIFTPVVPRCSPKIGRSKPILAGVEPLLHDVWIPGFKVWGSGFRVQGSGFGVQGLGFAGARVFGLHEMDGNLRALLELGHGPPLLIADHQRLH